MRINFNNPAAAGMIGGGVALMLIAVLVDTGFKPQTVDQALAPGKKKIDAYKLDEHKNKKTTDETLQQVQTRVWKDPDDQIAPKALDIISSHARKAALKVTTYRPQKEVPAGALITLPLATTVEGGFPAVASFIKDFEENEPLLVIESVQMTASDESTHNVSAAIEFVAYVDPNRPTPDTGDGKSKGKGKATTTNGTKPKNLPSKSPATTKDVAPNVKKA